SLMITGALMTLLMAQTARAQFGGFNFADFIGPAISVATNQGTKGEQAGQIANIVSGVFLGNGQEPHQPPPRPPQQSYYSQYGGSSSGGGSPFFGSALGPSPSSNYGRGQSSFGGSPYGNSNSFGGNSNSFGGNSFGGNSFGGQGGNGFGGIRTSTVSSFGDYEDGSSIGTQSHKKTPTSSFGSGSGTS
ncbi:hypothetical protein PFISCL1PPCAC_11444, partial [Pristionchus fissidentatus]